MENTNNFSGFPVEINSEKVDKWSSLIVKTVWVVLVVGIIVGLVLWYTVGGTVGDSPADELGKDLRALAWTVTAALIVALMSVRQMLLAEGR